MDYGLFQKKSKQVRDIKEIKEFPPTRVEFPLDQGSQGKSGKLEIFWKTKK